LKGVSAPGSLGGVGREEDRSGTIHAERGVAGTSKKKRGKVAALGNAVDRWASK